MIQAAVTWLTCVLGAVGLVALGVRMAGKDARWVGRHLPGLIVLSGVLAYCIAWGGTKPPTPPPTPPPTKRGLTLSKPFTDPNFTRLEWSRDDGSNSVGKTYKVQYRRGSKWIDATSVTGETNATVGGFYIRDDVDWRIMEEGDE